MQQIILPYPTNRQELLKGSIDCLKLGPKKFRVSLPPNLAFGEKIRLKGLAEYVDDCFRGQDLILVLKEEQETFFKEKKDVLIDFPININSTKNAKVERLNLGDKKFDIKIPHNTEYGNMLRMRNIADIINGGFEGDILLRIVEKPNLKKGILHNINGNFVGFGTPSKKVFSIKFSLPFLFEAGAEYHFECSTSELYRNY